MASTTRENERAPVVELEFSKTPTVSRAAYIMKPGPITEKPAAWRFCTSDCIALDRLVEVALSPTGILDSSFRNNAKTAESQVPSSELYSKPPKSAVGFRDGEGGEDGDSAEKRRYCCSSNGIKLTQPAAPSPSSPSPSSEAPNHQRAGYFQQQQQQQQKLKSRLSSFNEISKLTTPAGSSSSSLRVTHVEHPHAKRFRLTPRFKALVDISC